MIPTLLREGAHLLTVREVAAYTTYTTYRCWRVRMVSDTGVEVYCWFSPKMKARFMWQEICEDFRHLPSMVGRSYLVEVEICENHRFGLRNQVQRFLAEVQR